jgi:Intracellular proteinase inhibitor
LDNRLILPLLCAASVAFAAVPSFSHDDKPVATSKTRDVSSAPIVTRFDVTRPNTDGDRIRFSLNIKNNTAKMLELRFPSGQTHDFVVKDFAGKEIWRWSSGRMFTSVMRSTTIKGRSATTYAESWSTKGQHGAFTAVAILKSDNYPVESAVQFVLP